MQAPQNGVGEGLAVTQEQSETEIGKHPCCVLNSRFLGLRCLITVWARIAMATFSLLFWESCWLLLARSLYNSLSPGKRARFNLAQIQASSSLQDKQDYMARSLLRRFPGPMGIGFPSTHA